MRCPIQPAAAGRSRAECGRACRALRLTPPSWLPEQLEANSAAGAGEGGAYGTALIAYVWSELVRLGVTEEPPHLYTLNAAGTLRDLGVGPLAHRMQ